MKIIGETKNGYILEASRDEVANVIGYYDQYDASSKTSKIQVGAELQVAQMYRQLYTLSTEAKELTNIAANLRAAAALVDTLPNPIVEIEVGPDKEGQ